jgi:hypothetical protein
VIYLYAVCVLLCAVLLIIRGRRRREVGALRIAYFGIAYFGISYFEIAYFGIAYFRVAYFGVAYFGTEESNCLLCGRLASFE